MTHKRYLLFGVVCFVILTSFFAAGQDGEHNFTFDEDYIPTEEEDENEEEDESFPDIGTDSWKLACQLVWQEAKQECKHFIQSAVAFPGWKLGNKSFDAALGCMEQKTAETCNSYRPDSATPTEGDGNLCNWCGLHEIFIKHFGVKGACIHNELNIIGCPATMSQSLGYLILQKGLVMPKSWEQAICLRASVSAEACAAVTEQKCSFCPLPQAYGWYKNFPGICFQESIMTFNGTDQCANLADLPKGAYDFLSRTTTTTTRKTPPVILEVASAAPKAPTPPPSAATTTIMPRPASTPLPSGGASASTHQGVFLIAVAAVLLNRL